MNNLLKLLPAFAAICFLGLPIAAAEPERCNLTLSEAPAIYGFKLGMPMKDFAAAKQQQTPGPPSLVSYEIKSTKNLDYITSLKGQFFEDKLYFFEVGFDNKIKHVNARQQAQNLSKEWQLPFGFWEFDEAAPSKAKMSCAEFEIKIDSLDYKIALTDLIVSRKVTNAAIRK